MSIRILYRIILIIVLFHTPSISISQVVDSSFGVNGYIPYDIGANSELNDGVGNNTAIQSDGKIVVAISKFDPNIHSDLNFYTYRYNPDGSPDSTFGVYGASGIFAGDQSVNRDLKVQPDGKIVVIGETEYCILGVCGAPQFFMMRLNADGSIDTTFGQHGILLTTDIFDTAGLYALGARVLLAANGKYIIAGKGASGNPFAARLNNNGSLDTTFAYKGIFSDTSYSVLTDIIQDSNGNLFGLLLAYNNDTINTSDVKVFKLNANGLLDQSYGLNGKKSIDISNRDFPTSLAVRSDNKLVITGYSRPGYSYGFGETENGFIIILNPDGSQSSIFPQGYMTYEIPGDSSTMIYKVLITSGDRMLLGGNGMYKMPSGNYVLEAFISYFDENGNLIANFNSSGYMKFDYGLHSTIGSLACFNDIDLTSNGDIIATGYRNPITHNVHRSVFLLKLMDTNILGGFDFTENKIFSKLVIFPNPAVNSTTVEFQVNEPGEISIDLVDQKGRVIYNFIKRQFRKSEYNYENLILPSNLSRGQYIIVVKRNQLIIGSEKIVINRE